MWTSFFSNYCRRHTAATRLLLSLLVQPKPCPKLILGNQSHNQVRKVQIYRSTKNADWNVLSTHHLAPPSVFTSLSTRFLRAHALHSIFMCPLAPSHVARATTSIHSLHTSASIGLADTIRPGRPNPSTLFSQPIPLSAQVGPVWTLVDPVVARCQPNQRPLSTHFSGPLLA